MQFTVPGKPVGKQRVRVTRRGTYTPTKTINFEARVAQIAGLSCRGQRFDGPCRLEVVAYFPRPKNRSGKRWPDGPIHAPTCRTDLDNVVKGVSDGLQASGVLVNDSRVVELKASKWWTAKGELPRTVITLVALEPE